MLESGRSIATSWQPIRPPQSSMPSRRHKVTVARTGQSRVHNLFYDVIMTSDHVFVHFRCRTSGNALGMVATDCCECLGASGGHGAVYWAWELKRTCHMYICTLLVNIFIAIVTAAAIGSKAAFDCNNFDKFNMRYGILIKRQNIYRVAQLKWGQLTFLMVTFECIVKNKTKYYYKLKGWQIPAKL